MFDFKDVLLSDVWHLGLKGDETGAGLMALERAGVRTLGDAAYLTQVELLSIRGFSHSSFFKLKRVLSIHKLTIFNG